MQSYSRISAAAAAAICVGLTACGGGAGVGGGSSASAQDVPAQYAGVYLSSSQDPCVATGQYIDSFVVDAQNTAYRGCGNQYWTGPLTGSLHVDPNYAGAVSGSGSGNLHTYTSTGAPGTTATLSGMITGTTRALSGIPVTYIDFKQAGTTNGQQFQAPATAATLQTITRDYSTFAGAYYERWLLSNPTATATLAVKNTGAFSATTKFGTIAGQITNFDSTYGVHNVQATLTVAPGAAPVVMTGILAPAPSFSGVATDYTGVMLGLSAPSIGFAIMFVHGR